MELTLIIELVIAIYLVVMGLVVETPNIRSTLLFKALPLIAGIYLLVKTILGLGLWG